MDICSPADKDKQQHLLNTYGSKIQFLVLDVTDAHAVRMAVEVHADADLQFLHYTNALLATGTGCGVSRRILRNVRRRNAPKGTGMLLKCDVIVRAHAWWQAERGARNLLLFSI
jgi:hypothetical protein